MIKLIEREGHWYHPDVVAKRDQVFGHLDGMVLLKREKTQRLRRALAESAASVNMNRATSRAPEKHIEKKEESALAQPGTESAEVAEPTQRDKELAEFKSRMAAVK